MSKRTTESSCQMVMIPDFVLVFDIFSILTWVEFIGPMTEATLHCIIEVIDVLMQTDEAFVVVVISDSVFLELDHTGDELLLTVGPVYYAIKFL